MSCQTVELRDICKIKSGKRLPLGYTFADDVTEYPYIRARDIKNGKISSDDLVYIEEEVRDKIKKYIVNAGDIVITIVGASVGDVGYVPRGLDGYNLTENAVRLTGFNSKVNSKYLLYLLNSKKYWELMQQIAGGSAQPKLGIYKIESIKVRLPDIEVQNRVVRILDSYDDLIENNRKQIKLLEEAAQRLYKEWFVDLRFPGHKTTPIINGLPEGWDKVEVGTCIAKVARTKQVMTADIQDTGCIPVVDQSRDFVAGYTDAQETIVDLGYPVIVFGDHTRILKYIQFPFAKGADGTQLIVSNTNRMPQSLFYCSLVNVDLSNHHYARHFKYLKAEEIWLPSLEIASRFDAIVAPLFKQAQVLRDKCILAAQARDRLLPKLMNGEIGV